MSTECPPQDSPHPLGQGTLLIVDDDTFNRDVLCRRLCRAGYTTVPAANGEQALERVLQQPFDLVLLDVKMPDMDGFAVLKSLRSTYTATELPIIMTTVISESADIVTALTLGANDYVTKPIDLPVVLARIRTQLSLKWANAEMAKAKEAAEAATCAKSTFLAVMSHELRTPMNGMLGMLNLLRYTTLTPGQREYMETAYNSAQALLILIDDLLDVSKIEAGKLELERIDFDVRQTIEDAAALFSERAYSKGLELVCDIPANVPVLLRGDPTRLRQILTNLLGNAIKFTEQGEVVVRVGDVHETATSVQLRFEIHDTGIGIAPEVQGQLFQAFTQAERSISRRYGGTGLGLAISKQLVELMGGSIGVESEAGQGATFWFTACFAPVAPGIRPQRSDLHDVPVLVVDTHATSRAVLEQHLRAWGLRPQHATDARQALAMLREAVMQGQPYPLALLDRQLPDMDGIALARTIKADPLLASVQLVLMGLFGQCEDSVWEAGIALHLHKPVRQSALYDILLAALGKTCASMSAPAGEALPTALQGHILLVEDEPINRRVIQAMLDRLGVLIDCATNGQQALAAIAQHHYDLVFMDCQLPDMDGFETTRRLRQQEQQQNVTRLPIIAMTANAQRGDQERCLAAGMDDYVTKPVERTVLVQVLSRWLPTHSS
jgi:two-component system, sensor histidine kinase and response regulator